MKRRVPDEDESATGALRSAGSSRSIEQLALFTCAMAGDGAGALLEGLRPRVAPLAARMALAHNAQSSKVRHSQLAAAFAPPPDVEARVRTLASRLSPALREAFWRALPPYLRPQDTARGVTAQTAPSVRAWAARLARECTR